MGPVRLSELALMLSCLGTSAVAENLHLSDEEPLRLPPVGGYELRVLGPRCLELTLITTQSPGAPSTSQWNFVDSRGQPRLPAPKSLLVSCDGTNVPITALGFRRRAVYAPLKQRDLRIGNYLYLLLALPVGSNQVVEVRNPDHHLWQPPLEFKVGAEPFRWSPVLHVNQTGYLPDSTKTAMVGYYLGSLGEMDVTPQDFELLDARTNGAVFHGTLKPRLDRGFPFSCYQKVLEADFSAFKTPGEYRLFVSGLGASFPFRIDDGVAAAFARTYALGLYHQRCGTANALPFTRFTHGPCHTAPAEIPNRSKKFAAVNECLAKMTADFKDNPRHTAPQLKNVDASLYPFVNRGTVDVSGGHHDAGDYSKYTINSAALVHHLVIAADLFPGVGALDNLGLPESGDGKSDLLEEAKWEADFLAKMQDLDGGFYFLVYPREREYEDNVLPDKGDPQLVFPKNTTATAAATAALAQCASSPLFKKQFPADAARYLEKAKKGWAFLTRALDRYGQDGAYQKITHYGNEFMHDDELAWAATELFLATGDPQYSAKVSQWLNPTDPAERRWGWWRLYEAYGCATRSYAFAARTGRLDKARLDSRLLADCENEIAAAGEDQLRRAEASAYGTSFPEEAKRTLNAGWYFSEDAAFDLAVACQLDYPALRDPRPRMLGAILSNLNYEQGCNPVNVTYLTGLGWKRQREIVHQYALNDRRLLPPTGIPLGNIQAGFGWNYTYNDELGKIAFPSDGEGESPYPFYDRWGDGFNLSQEFVALNQARALGCLAWLMARTPLKDQPWKSAPGRLEDLDQKSSHIVRLTSPGLDLSAARIVWEAGGFDPQIKSAFSWPPGKVKLDWLEAEAQLPDGRRVFAVRDFSERK